MVGLEIEDYYNLKFIQSYDVSKDGGKIVYSLVEFKETPENNDFHHEEEKNLWMVDTVTKDTRQLTFGGTNIFPSFSPDGQRLVFCSQRDKKMQLYHLQLTGGEAQKITDLANGVISKTEWIDDDTIVFTALSNQEMPSKDSPYRVIRDFYRLDGMGIAERLLKNIYTYRFSTDRIERVVEDNMNHIQIFVSPDATQLLSLVILPPDDKAGFYPHLQLIDLESGNTRRLTDLLVTACCWIDSDTIVFAGFSADAKVGTKKDLYQYRLSTDELQNLTKEDEYGFFFYMQADMPTTEARMYQLLYQDNTVYGSTQIGGNVVVRSYDMNTDEITLLSTNDTSDHLWAVSDDWILVGRSDHFNPLDVYRFNVKTGVEERLTQVNHMMLENREKPVVHNFKFQSFDGKMVEGWYTEPATESKGPYPSLLNIHGGPHLGFGSIFQFENHYLLNAGYGIIMINHRASLGYGEEFATELVGEWGNKDYNDLMAGVDYVIAQGWADPDRLGCFGLSGGGNLSSWIVGQTNRFKAAIPENPVTNWRSFFGTSDIGRWFGEKQMGGLPWDIPEVYRKSSPVTYAHTCTTPVLLIQHENDMRCPPEQADQFYAILKEVGCTVEMLRMPGTAHIGSIYGPLKIREAENRAMLDWFARYI